MDTQQVTSAPILLGNNEVSAFNQPLQQQQQQGEKSILRQQLDDLLFGSVKRKKKLMIHSHNIRIFNMLDLN